MNFEQPTNEPTRNDVTVFAHALMAQFTAEGNKDSEPDAIKGVLTQLLQSKISSREAMQRLRDIEAARIQR